MAVGDYEQVRASPDFHKTAPIGLNRHRLRHVKDIGNARYT
jgi:hypothetical protein